VNVEEVLDILDEMLDQSWSLPLSGGRCVLDAEKVRDLIDDIRVNLPTEIRHARAIVVERSEILEAARKEGGEVVRKAEERAKLLVAQEEIVKQAQARANDIIAQTQNKAREIRGAAHSFSSEMLSATEESLQKALIELRNTRQAMRNRAKK